MISPAELDLMEPGDRFYMKRTYRMGNTKRNAESIYSVEIVSIERSGDRIRTAMVIWNGMNRQKFFRSDLCRLYRFHPKPKRDPFQDTKSYEHSVERAAKQAAEERAAWKVERNRRVQGKKHIDASDQGLAVNPTQAEAFRSWVRYYLDDAPLDGSVRTPEDLARAVKMMRKIVDSAQNPAPDGAGDGSFTPETWTTARDIVQLCELAQRTETEIRSSMERFLR